MSGDRPPQGPASWTTMTASVAKLTGSQDGMAGGRSIHRPQGLGKIPRTFLGGPFHIFFFFTPSPIHSFSRFDSQDQVMSGGDGSLGPGPNRPAAI